MTETTLFDRLRDEFKDAPALPKTVQSLSVSPGVVVVGGVAQWHGTAAAHQSNLADIRNFALGLGPEAVPAGH